MNIQVLQDASPAIQLHVLTVFIAIILTLCILFGRKGTRLHRVLGRIWAVLMLVTSLVSFGIHETNPPNGYSWIHLLSIFTIVTVAIGWIAARSGNIERHRTAMLSIIIGGLVIAGAFTLLPGRLMHQFLFG